MFKFKKIGLFKRISITIVLLISIIIIAMIVYSKNEEQTTKVSQISLNKQNEYKSSATIDGVEWYYDLDDDGNAINVHYKEGELGENVTIPQTLDGHTVVDLEYAEIGSSNFFKNIFGEKENSVKTVNIPEGVTSIGDYAFYGCSNLTTIEIPENVKKINGYAFYRCTGLRYIKIPINVISIGINAFHECNNLLSIEVDVNNQKYSSENGVLYNKSKNMIIKCPAQKKEKVVISEGVTSIAIHAFYRCSGLTEIEIPESVTLIGDSAFYGCSSLTSINIPEEVTSIKNHTFSNCSSLTTINIPEGVKCIEKSAFYGCSSLTSINIPEGVTSIEDSVFYGCSKLTNILIPEGVTSIGKSAFLRCSSLTSINIPEGVTSIEDSVFYGCSSLTNINIPEGVTSIGDNAFQECSSLTSINIPEGVTNIKHQTFYKCSSLTGIKIPESVTFIGSSAFYECRNLTSINIPEGVTSIGAYAFFRCSSLNTIEIPEGVSDIGKKAFYGCGRLISINIPERVISIGEDAFSDCQIIIPVADQSEDILEVDLPEIIKRANNESDFLYTEDGFEFTNCEFNIDRTKIKIKYEDIINNLVQVKIKSGKLSNLELLIVPSGTITYNNKDWTNKNIIAVLYIQENERIINNDGNNTYIFTENGEFTFRYIDINNEEKGVTAKVDKIDKEAPIIYSIEGNPTEWTNEDVTLTVNADDNLCNRLSYNFFWDGGGSSVTSNECRFSKNQENIVIKVVDYAGNTTTSEPISITKIKELNIDYYDITEEDGKKYIDKIMLNTSIETLKENIKTNGIIEIYKDEIKITDEEQIVTTGMEIVIKFGEQEEKYVTVVTGDITGNGKMGIGDLSKLSRYAAGLDNNLTGAYLRASDIVKDGKYGKISDILKMSRVLAGMDTL